MVALMFLIILISILQHTTVFSSALVIKLANDITADNIIYMHKTTIIFGIFTSELCSASCDKYGTESINFRSFDKKNKICNCFHVSDQFRDSRYIAPAVDGRLYLVDRELFCNMNFDYSFLKI